jgi:hypothetical protein
LLSETQQHAGYKSHLDFLHSVILLFEHDLFGEPVSTSLHLALAQRLPLRAPPEQVMKWPPSANLSTAHCDSLMINGGARRIVLRCVSLVSTPT